MTISKVRLSRFLLSCILLCWINAQIAEGTKLTSLLTRSEDYNVTATRVQREMLAMQRWKNAEKLIHKFTLTALRNFIVYAAEQDNLIDVSSKCFSDIGYVIRGLATAKYWAYRMIDASSRIPAGMLTGTLADFGDYDSCLAIEVKDRFKGEYCSVRLTPVRFTYEEIQTIDLQKYVHLKENVNDDFVLTRFLDLLHPYYAFFSFRIALCVPSSCNQTDIEAFIDSASHYVGLDWESKVVECIGHDDESATFKPHEILAVILLGAIGFVAITGTFTEIYLLYTTKDKKYMENTSLLTKIFLCFSFVTNTKRLLKEDTNPDSIHIFHGLKFVTILWVILNHTYNNMKPEFMRNAFYIKDIMAQGPFQVVINGYPSVDTFFFISGVILVYARMRSNVHLNAFLFIFRRAWRLGPAIFFLIMFYFVFGRLGNGPVWREYVNTNQEACQKYWWTNVLFINNFYQTENMCMGWLWYVGADMQLYIFSLVVLIPIKRRPKLGLWILGMCYVLGLGVLLFNQLYFALPPSVVMSAFNHPIDIFRVTERIYYPFYVHLVPYCAGMATGYVLYKNPKIRIPFWLNAFGWICSVSMGLAVVYGVTKWNNYVVSTQAESLIYALGAKIAWGVGLAWVTIICYSGNGGLITKFLTWRALVPFSRITYSTYLVHMFIEVWFLFGIKSTLETRHRLVLFLYFSFVITSFMLAFVYTQLFESPFMLLERLMFTRGSQMNETKLNGQIPEDAIERNNVNHAYEYEEKNAHVQDAYIAKLEYKSEVKSSGL